MLTISGLFNRNPHHLIFLFLASLVVFPDVLLNWLSERTDWTITWVHYVLFEVFAISLIVGTILLFDAINLRIHAWLPFASICLIAVIRFLFWFTARKMSNFENK